MSRDRQHLLAAALVFALTPGAMSSVQGQPAQEQQAQGQPALSALYGDDAIRNHVEFLASEALEGRLTGTEGASRAADYLIEQLRHLGAKPLPGAAGFRLPFEFTAGITDAGSRLGVAGQEFSAADGALRALSFSEDAAASGELVFAGYGLSVPDSQSYPYDSYFGLDVADKIVVVLRYIPEDVDAETRVILSRYSGLRYKALQARERGARGLLVVTGPRSPNAGELVKMTFDTAVASSGIVAASIAGVVAESIFAAAGRDFEGVQAELDTGNLHVAGFDLGVAADLSVGVHRELGEGHNVVGYVPASDTTDGVDRPWVVLGAHYDHLGRGLGGNSLAGKDEAGRIHNGADDNASGVAAVLAAGARLADMSRARNVALAFWSGEEIGTIGSLDFARGGDLPMDQVAANLNFDMVGRSRDNRLVVQAVGSSAEWPGLIERSNVVVGFDIKMDDNPYLPTDSSSFNQARVPTLTFFTDVHIDYHRPSDDAELLNIEDLTRVAHLGALVAHRVSNLDAAPQFVAVQRARGDQQGSRDTVRAFTGTIPDYVSDIEGLLLGGVIEGGPAEAAGLRAGDVIIEFGGQTIANIYDYTYALDAVKIGEPLDIVFLRAGERQETTMTPRARS